MRTTHHILQLGLRHHECLLDLVVLTIQGHEFVLPRADILLRCEQLLTTTTMTINVSDEFLDLLFELLHTIIQPLVFSLEDVDVASILRLQPHLGLLEAHQLLILLAQQLRQALQLILELFGLHVGAVGSLESLNFAVAVIQYHSHPFLLLLDIEYFLSSSLYTRNYVS